VVSTEIIWPDEIDLRIAEHPDYVHLSRVLVGLHRLSGPDHSVAGADMLRETQRLVDVLEAAQWRIFLLVTRLRDGTATANDQREGADLLDELVDLLRSHADDTDAGLIPAPRDFERGCA